MDRLIRALAATLSAIVGAGFVVSSVGQSPGAVTSTGSPPRVTSSQAMPSKALVNRPPARRTPVQPTPAVAAAAPRFLKIPSVGLAVRVSHMLVIDGVVNPPTADIAYWLSNRGSMPASKTA